MAALRLHRTADGVGAIFPDEILDQMHVGEGDTLNISRTSEGILLTRVDAPRRDVMAVAKQLMEENAAVLRALAK